MKYNNKLSLTDYLQVINNIVNEYFDIDTKEYTPQVGEIFAVCEFYNRCVELEENEKDKIQPITNIMDAQMLFDNEEFIGRFSSEVDGYYSDDASLTFGHAYRVALDIVENKKSDANAFATALSLGLDAILKSFTDTFTDEKIQKLSEIGKQIMDGKISNEAIVEAYGNSDRFKQV